MSKDFENSRVPIENRQALLGLALVHAGLLTAMDQFMLGAVLGDGMTLSNAFIAITIASLIFAVITCAIGYIGMQEGLSGTLIARHYGFGKYGTVVVGLLTSVSLIGWFGVQNAVFAKGINHFFKNELNNNFIALISGLTITILVSFGFRSLKIIAKIAVPFFIMVIIIIAVSLIKDNMSTFTYSHNSKISISEAITMIVGGCILATIMTPDITRFAKNKNNVFTLVLITIIVGEFIINGLAIILANLLQSADVVNIMSISTGTFGLIAIILSTLRVNDLNLYSSALGVSNAFSAFSIRINFRILIVLSGVAGTFLSISGILDNFIVFLNVLGYIFPPVIAVILVDYYFLSRQRKRSCNSVALLSCVIGGFIGTVDFGIPVINSIFTTSCLYYLIDKRIIS